MSEVSGKLCVACGADCAGRPRVKDPAGRYYCKSCYEARQTRSSEPANNEHQLSMLDDLIGLEEVAADPKSCPNCGASVDDAAVLCVNCGYNFNHGMALPPMMHSAPKTAGTAWPIVIGIISVVLGGGGFLLHGLNMGVSVLTGNPIAALSGMLPTTLAFWLGFGGIGLLNRRPWGVAHLFRWAIAKIAFSVICLGFVTVLAAAMPRVVEDAFAADDMPLAAGLIVAILIAYLLWSITWPIFILAWFSRANIKTQIARW